MFTYTRPYPWLVPWKIFNKVNVEYKLRHREDKSNYIFSGSYNKNKPLTNNMIIMNNQDI